MSYQSLNSNSQQQQNRKEQQIMLQEQLPKGAKSQSCLPKCKVRTFSSKGAMLVLIWNFAVWASNGSPVTVDHVYYPNGQNADNDKSLIDIIRYTDVTLILWLIVSVLSGWLADVYFGRHKVVRTGLVLVWIGQLCVCATALLQDYWTYESSGEVLDYILEVAVFIFLHSGTPALLVNSVQLGIDQMPEASAEQIVAFVYWFVLWMYIAIFTGIMIQNYLQSVYVELGFTVLLTSAIVSDFLLSKTWITDQPGSGNPFKGAYRVLKYAWKHKYPVQRSAFTYTEDEIPSRIDFGKEKYGGPFTTEQVEDVKTILRILVLSLPAATMVFCITLAERTFDNADKYVTFHNFTNISSQHQTVLMNFVASSNTWVIILLLISEFVVYPLARNWIPSMLKRIGIAMFTALPYSLIFLILNIIAYIHEANVNIFWLDLSTSILSAIRIILLTTTVLEFICAQSPLAVKGFFIGFVWSLYALSIILAKVIFLIWDNKCDNRKNNACEISYYVFVLVLSSVGFIAYCFVARWYKKRSRDEPSYRHTLVEEVYDRYISAYETSSSD